MRQDFLIINDLEISKQHFSRVFLSFIFFLLLLRECETIFEDGRLLFSPFVLAYLCYFDLTSDEFLE